VLKCFLVIYALWKSNRSASYCKINKELCNIGEHSGNSINRILTKIDIFFNTFYDLCYSGECWMTFEQMKKR
jgi:hypothetical protein